MKKLMLITALSLTVPFAYAEQPAAGAPEAASVSFSQIDTDQDGMITKQEASSFSAVEVVFDDIDANKDGALDAEEFYGPQQ
jgi:Ca2+-binding EF-hand superfamily protein